MGRLVLVKFKADSSLFGGHVQCKTAILDQVSGLGDYQTAFQEYDAPAPYLSVRISSGPEDEFP